MFAGFESETAAIEKIEANQLQVIKKADIFSEGKYKKMADDHIKDGDEHFVDLNEVEKPVTVEEYKRERDLIEQEKWNITNIKQKLAKYKNKHEKRSLDTRRGPYENSDLDYESYQDTYREQSKQIKELSQEIRFDD